MNVRLSKSLAWSSALVYDDMFYVNNYVIDLSLLTASMDLDQQNIAYDRMKVIVSEVLQDSVFIASSSSRVGAYRNTGAKIIEFPEQPVDQIVGMMLMIKLNAVMQQRMVVTDISISSEHGDEMKYHCSHDDNIGPFAQPGWWSDHRPVYGAERRARSRDKVVAMDRITEWSEYGLEWESNDGSEADNKVVFADFPRNEDK
jgi:hypothetical protein